MTRPLFFYLYHIASFITIARVALKLTPPFPKAFELLEVGEDIIFSLNSLFLIHRHRRSCAGGQPRYFCSVF